MLVNAKKARIISICCTTSACFMVTIHVLPRSLMVAQMQRDQFEPPHTVVYPGYFPYDIRGTFAFLISCFGQIVAAYSGTLSYISVDTFITMLVLHVCAQISNLRHSLEDLSSGTNEMANDFTKKLIWIVKGHEHLNWYAQSIDNSFNMMLLIQILGFTVQVCFEAFQLFRIMEQDGDKFPVEELIFVVLYVLITLIQLYLYCYAGEMLIVESSAIGTSAYMSQWYNLFPKDARNIFFVMHRCSIPLRLTFGKIGTFSMETFSQILRSTVGYLSVLLTVTDKKNN
uniref:odorant receptor 67c-like n=1 Tax=Vespula vulgaris TaxID=7454 RepID=UPI00223B38CE|nr:odorant receptor 67c-like [Vespula vulgaris]